MPFAFILSELVCMYRNEGTYRDSRIHKKSLIFYVRSCRHQKIFSSILIKTTFSHRLCVLVRVQVCKYAKCSKLPCSASSSVRYVRYEWE